MSRVGGGPALRHGLSVPPFGELADPLALLELARLAEARGWDGVFPWDHVQTDDPQPVADVWVALAAMATVTEHLLLGPMVTPLPRRRPHKLAREVVTLDHLSHGRLILGLGLGVDHAREFSAFGEEVGDRQRGAMLDEGLELLCGLLSGEEVHHHGDYYTADGVTFLPTPVRPGGVPIWMAARTMAEAPLRRAARHDGTFIIERDPEEITAMLEVVSAHRGGLEGFDVATMAPGADPGPFVAAGVTWWMTVPGTGAGTDDVFGAVEEGPPR